MRKFYYVDTGHRVGLDRFRRAVAILNALGDDEVTLLCSDFRIAHEARHFGIKNSVGIDLVRNIVNITHHGDALIFDSAEANPLMLEDMRSYFSKFIRVSDDLEDKRAENEFLISPYFEDTFTCKAVIVDDKYFGKFDKTIEIGFFFGDDDYEKDLEKHLDILEGLNAELLLGFYYFFDYEEMLKKKFKKYYEFEEYDEFITASKILITSSPQAVLDSLASGGRPIYLKRSDYSNGFIKLFLELNIPVINGFDKTLLSTAISQNLLHSYNQVPQNSIKLINYLKDKFYL
ncbi:MAG: hypothetical protein PHX13_11775 [Thiovulaceae bacterium]|nr:hypothetical protein [Sulfurimonadaceae bacterium]